MSQNEIFNTVIYISKIKMAYIIHKCYFQFVTIEAWVSAVSDLWPETFYKKNRKQLLSLFVSICLFLAGIPTVTGVNIFHMYIQHKFFLIYCNRLVIKMTIERHLRFANLGQLYIDRVGCYVYCCIGVHSYIVDIRSRQILFTYLLNARLHATIPLV